MIEVELRRVPDGGHDYTTVARLQVGENGTYETEDPEEYLPVDLPVLVIGDDGKPRRVTLAEDAATWARNLDTILRTGYLVPVITRDDDATSASSAG